VRIPLAIVPRWVGSNFTPCFHGSQRLEPGGGEGVFGDGEKGSVKSKNADST
jgi:hypothetical protein